MRLGKPQDHAEQYQKHIIGDVELYVHAALTDVFAKAPEVRIEVERTLFSKKLVVYGITI